MKTLPSVRETLNCFTVCPEEKDLHNSADYRLINIFIPLYLFIHSKEHTKLDLFYAIMFALLLIPKDYYFLPGVISDSGAGETSISVVFNVVIMLVMMLVIIESGVAKWRKIATEGVVR